MDATPLVTTAYLAPVIALGLYASAGLAVFFAMRRGVASGRHGLRRIALLAGIVFALLPWEGVWAYSLVPAQRAEAQAAARLWGDEVIRRIEEKNGPITQEKAATALYSKLVEEFDFVLDNLPEMRGNSDALIGLIASSDEIVRRFGQDSLSVIRITVLKALIKKIEIFRALYHLGGANASTITEALGEIDRRFWQDNDPTVQMLHIKSIIVYGAPNPGERSVRAETIHELDKKFLPRQHGNRMTEAEAVAAVLAIYNAIGQRFGAASDYAIALYLTERGMYLGRGGYYGAAIVFFDEVVHRFNKNDRLEIRLLVQDAIKLRIHYKARLSPQ